MDPRDFSTDALSPETLSPETLAALRAEIARDPALLATVRALDAAEGAARARLDAAVPDRSLLVLAALDEAGRADALADAERTRLHAARPRLARALDAHPCLLDVLRRIGREADDFEACWADAASETHAARPARADRAPERRAASRPSRTWRVGAAFALVLFAALAVLLVQRDAGLIEVEAGGAIERVALAGGTAVRLMPGATLAYPDPARKTVLTRRVRLEGDAYFAVARTGEPFVIETPSARITVYGTEFGVRSSGAATEVTLVEGSLALAAEGQGAGVRLAPGQKSRVVKGGLPTTPIAVDVPGALAWSGLFVFRDTPLSVALERLALRYNVRVEASEALASQQVTGTFEAQQPLADVLDALALTLGARVERTAGGYRLK